MTGSPDGPEAPAPPFDEAALRHRQDTLSEIRLHSVELGRGELVLLLHGFPDHWYGWRHQLAALAAAGYRVVAPDLRGYHRSERPAPVAAYRWPRLIRDVVELVEACGARRARLVGHDWGGVVAWMVASQHPGRVSHLAALNAPHPRGMARGLLSPRQLLRSWYVLFFQLPWLPEAILEATDRAPLVRMWRGQRWARRPGGEQALVRHREALREPGALTGPIHYYRAALRDLVCGRGPPARPVECPTLSLWGVEDPFLGPELATPPAPLAPAHAVEWIEQAGHWVHLDRPALVNRRLVDFLAGPGGARTGRDR